MDGRVLLVNMPFSGAGRPQIALGLLKAALGASGIPCDVAYLNLILAAKLGWARYRWFSGELPDMLCAGEWVFAHHFFGEGRLDGEGYIRHMREAAGADDATIAYVLSLRELVPHYLEKCLRSVDWSDYSVIGFTTTFEQNMAALSLARAVKEKYPDKVIVMGGGNCSSPMGEALLRSFDFVDYVFTGEADLSFTEFIERLYRREPVGDIGGLAYREGGVMRTGGPAQLVTDMDALPFPDYDDYFTQLAMTSLSGRIPLTVYFETARGCWWGAKHHCTFCGLNGLSMAFRSKSKDRALAEIAHLSSRYPVRRLAAVDNIMDMRYFRELLPELKRQQLGLSIFYETKANLTKEQVVLLKAAGVEMIQPGIESFSPRLLKLMRKGVSPLQNVQLLKWCEELGVQPMWNLLYGFPGESAADYQEMLPLLQSLTHLKPPTGSGPVRLDRYSPYFQSPESFGLIDAKPARVYQYIYPIPASELADIVYHYEFKFADGLDPSSYIGPVLRQLKTWDEARSSGATLRSRSALGRTLMIDDSRPGAAAESVRLEGWQVDVYEHCDQTQPLGALEDWLGLEHPEVPKDHLRQFLRWLVGLKLMAQDRDQFLSLALAAGPPAPACGVNGKLKLEVQENV